MIIKNHIKRLLVITFLFFGMKGIAQNLSNRGVDFWVGYGHHQFMEVGQSNSQEMVIYISAEQQANVTIKVEGTSWVRNYLVNANSVIVSDLIPKSGSSDARLISLPCSFVPAGTPCGGEGIFSNKGIHITSNVPVVAYAHIYGSASSGATMLMPVETWGYSYVTLNSKQSYANNCFSWVYVIAKEDNTVVEITPTAVTRSFKPANVPFTVTLNRGQIYQLMAGPEAGSAKPDLSGTTVKSIANSAGACNQIAVFAGSSRTSNPAACGSGGGDNDNQQCFPFQAWGKRYLTAPTSNSVTASTFMTNTYKIAVKDPTTVVKRNGVIIPLANLINNSYYTYESSTADYIQSDKPVMVAQFMTGGGGCLGGGGVGDPEMMYLSPIEQGIKKIGFFRNNQEQINVNYLTLIIPTAGVSSLTIDGSSTFNHTYAHPNLPGYTVVIKRWTSAQAQGRAQSDSAFTAITYGLGNVESYGYNAGTLINNLSAVGAIFNISDSSTTTITHPFACTSSPLKLSVLLGYPTAPSRLVWKISQVGGGITPNVDVVDNTPTPAGTQIVNGISYLKYNLIGAYTFADTGYYRVPILATHPSIENCNNTEELYYIIEVRRRPTPNFTFTHTGCVLDTVRFTGPSASANGYNINQWLWTFPGSVTASTQNTNQLFTTTGNVPVNLSLVTAEGCISDTTINVGVSAAPVVAFTTSPTALCVGSSVTFTDNSTYTGSTPISVSYWDFGDGTIINNGNPVTHTYTSPGSYTVNHVAGLGGACVGDTVPQVVTVYYPPYTTFTYPTGCLPANGIVQFNSTAYTPDGQAVNGHLWNFGDPASGAANTSTLANPTHTYPGFGNYTITYQATTVNGCSNDTTVNATFNLAPLFNYPALPSVCQNLAGTVSVATASVTNAVPGTGVYHGPGTTSAGLFSPSIAGAGLHTIWYVYTTTANCRDSVSQTITVKPTPDAAFTIPVAACLPPSGNVSFSYSGTALPGQTYLWNFGDPASGALNSSTLANPSHNYTTGPYTITLSVTANGCTKDSIVNNTFNVTPALAYPALAPVCQSLTGTVSVATATVTNGATGTGVYSGPGVTPAGLFSPSIAGAGSHVITYTFTGTGNCVSTITQTILVYPKPNASFTFPSVACLPTTGLVQFTYNGSVSAGQTYSWNFDDPASGANNTSTLASPPHNYTNTGNYDVTLTVTNLNGCVDDTVVNATFSVTPALAYPALEAICQSAAPLSVATATVTNGVSGTGVYSGPGVNAAGLFNPAVAGPGTHTITYTFTSTGNCVAVRTQTIVVNAKPNASFTFPNVACLPTTGLVQFTYNGSVSAGQTYSWNFDDPASGANNTSTLASPPHNYTNTGNYDVTLTVTNLNGCVDDTVVNATFSVTPALAYPALAAVCQSAAPLSVATATVTNGVSGTGVYSGPGVNAAGLFNPAVAGAGTHTITYTFTSTGNCVAVRTQTIVVNPKPAASFSINSSICLGQLAQLVNSSSIPSGTIASWKWFFGDGQTQINSNGNTFTHLYSAYGTYQVKLVTVSNNGCISDTARETIIVNAIPVAAFTMPASVCMPNGAVNFTNTSTVADNLALTYSWNFGDGSAPSTAVNASHVYASISSYNIRLRATSSAGCFKDSTRIFSAFYDKPVARFNVSPSILCQGTPNTFTDLSTAPNSTINTRLWTFGDGSTSQQANPTKTYAAPGNYEVTLVVTNPENCVSDIFKDTVLVYLQPVVDAGPSFLVPQGSVFQFRPTVNDSLNVLFNWSPGTNLSSTTVLRPTVTANNDATYTLTVTGDGNCTATDFLTVKIFRPLKIPNVFSPNGDGQNDTWRIDHLADYPGATVNIFNRYGQQVYSSTGYGTPWDGTIKGKPLPVATYYYIIELKNDFKPLNGSVTIVR
jgi:gliding motility-associated-like protein